MIRMNQPAQINFVSQSQDVLPVCVNVVLVALKGANYVFKDVITIFMKIAVIVIVKNRVFIFVIVIAGKLSLVEC